jgi:hypothetical protein
MRRGITMSMAAAPAAVALALVVALAGPAQAKGIQSATISGPGLDEPIEFSPPDGDGGDLAALTAVWEAMPGQPQTPVFMEEAPTGQLGPRYRITWRLLTGPDEVTAIRQDVYPYAYGGPLVHTPAGQQIFGQSTPGGWRDAPVALSDRLRALGVPEAGAVSASSAGGTQWPAVFMVAAGALALAGVGGAVAVRRAQRRERVAPVPL